MKKKPCPSCGSRAMSLFYEQKGVPVHSVLLMQTQEEAINYPRGDIALGFCQKCGFISNLAFDPGLHEYSSRYEETQGFSSTFNTFARRLAERLIQRYDLHKKVLVEIGCGKGEFLTLLCELGGNRGVGFDPAYVNERTQSEAKERITFIKDFFSEKYSNYEADFICCKMTLEHIHDVRDFVNVVRSSIGVRSDTIVFFQVPDVTRILRECAFEDIYYEHCSYFSPGSLAHLFRRCAFNVLRTEVEYDGQYMMIEANPSDMPCPLSLRQEEDFNKLAAYVSSFRERTQGKLALWRQRFREISESHQRVVLWGSGSKAVAYLTTLNLRDEIEYVVDINPHRQGTYMAGTGQEIVAPEFLKEYRPDIVIVMNPVYCQEITRNLQRMGLTSQMLTA